MNENSPSCQKLLAENKTLRASLAEAEETLQAIRAGQVDGLLVESAEGVQLFTLKGADQAYRILIEEMSEGAVTLSVEGLILYSNRRFAEIVGEPLENVIGRKFIDFAQNEEAALFQKLMEKASRGTAHGQLTVTASNQTAVPLHLSLSRLPAEASAAFCLVGADLTKQKAYENALRQAKEELERRVEERTASLARANQELVQANAAALDIMRDAIAARAAVETANQQLELQILHRRQSEQSLRESEERFRLLSKATNDAIWDWTLASNEVWWNEGYQTLFGYSGQDDEKSFQSKLERIHPEDRERISRAIDSALHNRAEIWSGEYRFRKRDGSWAFVLDRGYVIHDSAGKPVRMIGGMTDISQRKENEQRLAEQADLLNAAHEAIFVLDLNGKVIYWNKGAEKTYGWTTEESVGKALSALIGEDESQTAAAKEATLRNGEWRGELQKKDKKKKQLTLDSSWTLIRASDGAPKSILAIDLDITTQKSLELQFMRTQRLESIGTLAGGIAHDLNNVLTPILMAVELLKMSSSPAETAEMLATIETSARRGADLIKQVLSFARGMEGRRLTLNLRHIVSDIQTIIKETFPKNILLQINAPTDLWAIQGDPTQLHQVLVNLCVNARDALPTGGKLALKLQNVTLDETYLGMTGQCPPGQYVQVEVTDTGTGIPREIQERIFEPFFTTKEHGKGTGLGLSTVLAIMKSHKGMINVYSEALIPA